MAVALVAYTGCRAVEAAWIVFNKKVTLNNLPHLKNEGTYKADVPELITKTKHNYTWVLSDEAKDVWLAIKDYTCKRPPSWVTLYNGLFGFYTKILKTLNIDSKFAMRTIRCWHATQWVKHRAEASVMRRTALPNPLQHESVKTTLLYYAKKGSDNVNDAHKRCEKKYKKAYDRLKIAK